MTLLPLCLYDGTTSDTPIAILLAPDLDDDDIEVILADLPAYLDLNPDDWPTGQEWEIRRGWWTWTADLTPCTTTQSGAFEAVRLNRVID